MTEMTKPFLRKLCKDAGLYTTPSINDKLYLHYKGFSAIENLDEYTGLKVIWLEGNGLGKISGLENQTLLRTLYLHENLIEKIENIDHLIDLDNINLSKNYIKMIENMSTLKKLTSLNIAHNVISTLEGVRQVLELPALQTLDLQHNKIEDPAIVDIVAQIPDLRVLYLMGNPCVKQIRNYRKTIVAKCKTLKYLDDRPVFEEERRRVDAWWKVIDAGGSNDEATEAERKELQLIRKEKDDADERNFREFEKMMKEGQAIKKQRAADAAAAAAAQSGILMPPPPPESEINPFSGEAVIPVPESDELRKTRENRWNMEPPKPPTREEERGTKIAIEEIDDDEEDDEEEDEDDGVSETKDDEEEEEEEESTPTAQVEQLSLDTNTSQASSRPKFMNLLAEASQEVQANVKEIKKTEESMLYELD